MPLPIARTISSSAHGAVAPQGGEKNPGWQPIPHIQQLHPDGANAGYLHGERFCGPAVVAMLARGANRARTLSDARLIQELGQGLMSQNGSTPMDMLKMLERVDLSPGGAALSSSYTDAALQDHLRQGHKLMVQVGKFDPKTGAYDAHYILVRGMTADGNYRVSDPLAKEPHELSPQKLHSLVRRAPPDGGVIIPVASPRHVSDASTPDKVRAAFKDTRGKQHEVCGIMERRQEHRDYTLDLDYLTQKAQTSNYTRPVSPENMTAHEFADRLLWLKRNKDPQKALALLSLLQASPFPRDQRAYERVAWTELHQPGIGKKLLGDPCVSG